MSKERTFSRRKILSGIGTSVIVTQATGTAATVQPSNGIKEYWDENSKTTLISPIKATGDKLYFGRHDSLVAFNRTGEQLWEAKVGGGHLENTPTIENGIAYASTFTEVHAVSATTGEHHWSFETGWGGNSTPVVKGDTVYVSRGENKDENSGKLFALNLEDGSELWEFTLDADTWSEPAVSNGAVYVGDTSGTIYAIDATTGQKKWEYQTGSPVTGSPLVTDSELYICNQAGELHALDQLRGSLNWKAVAGKPLVGAKPTIAGEKLHVGDENGVHAFDLQKGTKMWSHTTSGTATSPVVREDDLYYCSRDNVISCLNNKSGSLRWRVEFPEVHRRDVFFHSISNRPSVVENVLYVMTDSGKIYALGEE